MRHLKKSACTLRVQRTAKYGDLVAEYILQQKGHELALLEAARNGLLEVVGIRTIDCEATSPVPPNWGVAFQQGARQPKHLVDYMCTCGGTVHGI